jgi:group I intron endonuclease
MIRQPGIYRIRELATGRSYIGSSLAPLKRLRGHQLNLERGTHFNRHLQFSWSKYGAQAFALEQLVDCSIEELARKEQQFIDSYIEHDLPLYNVKPASESRKNFVFRHTPDAKAKISRAFKGIKFSQEHRDKLCKPKSLSARINMSLAQKGRKKPAEFGAKMSRLLKGKSLSLEHRAKVSAALKGRSPSLMHRRNLSLAIAGTKFSDERREQCRVRQLGKKHSPETRLKMSASHRNPLKSQRNSGEMNNSIHRDGIGQPSDGAQG